MILHRILLACGVALACAGCSPPAEPAGPPPSALVTTTAVLPGGAGDDLVLYGQAETDPGELSTLAAPLEAQVATIEVAVGQSVGAGTLVATLKPSAASQLEIDRLKRDAAAARLEAQRVTRLRTDGLASDTEVTAARAAAATAEAAASSLGGRAASLALRAPGPAVVEALPAAPGDLLPVGGVVAKLSRSGAIRARFGVTPSLQHTLRAGQPIRLAPLADDGRAYAGVIQSVDSRVDPASRMAGVLVTAPAASGLLVGEPLKASVSRAGPGRGLSVPHAALLYDAATPYVMLVVGGKAAKRPVVVAADDGERALVTGALKAGDQVVTEGGAVLEDGMAVRSAPAARPAPAKAAS